MIISLVLDSLGFFEWSALHIVRLACGSGKLLFVYSIALGSVVATAVVSASIALTGADGNRPRNLPPRSSS
jgi:arsenical pump membrane protein